MENEFVALRHLQRRQRHELRRSKPKKKHPVISRHTQTLIVLLVCITASLLAPIAVESFSPIVTPYYHHPPYLPLSPRNSRLSSSRIPNDTLSLESDEPLSVIFQRAVVLQRAGDHHAALKEYEMFIKAAEQCNVSPDTYAEVHVNIGAVYLKDDRLEEAKRHFELALGYRAELGTAHVNLALLALRNVKESVDPKTGVAALKDAEGHCRRAIEIDGEKDGDSDSVTMARRLLDDIVRMLSSAGRLR